MTHKQLQKILWTFFREQADKNPYFIYIYNWGIVNTSGRMATAQEIALSLEKLEFPPIGKN